MDNIQKKFEQLFHSVDEGNVKLALEMAKGLPVINLKQILQEYQEVYECVFDITLDTPINVEQIVQLNQPYLELCDINPLPESLGCLTYLKELYADNMGLDVLPENIGKLAQLEQLELRTNNLELLPEKYWALEAIETFVFI